MGSRRQGASFDAFFSYGFRPFFFGAAVFAVLLMGVWLVFVATSMSGSSGNWLPITGSPLAWHAHEMIFGFAAAAIAGFLLTAVPNWTGALPISGMPLVVLFATWMSGRIALFVSGMIPYEVAAGFDLIFLPLLGVTAARQLFVRPAMRNLVFLVLISVLTLTNAAFHLGTAGYIDLDPLRAAKAGLFVVVVKIAIIGGRVIPAFTHNWLHLNRPGAPLPQRYQWLDVTSALSIVIFAVLAAFDMQTAWQGTVALVAAVLNGVRLWHWQGWSTRSEPIVLILHLGYLWLVAGLALTAASAFQAGIPATLASHAFGTGAAGTMIMAIMSRASLGHTGRPLVAPTPIVWAYGLLSAAAVVRVAGPLVAPGATTFVLTLAALAWMGAFALFTIVYAPILSTPRVHTKVVRS